MTRCPHGNRVIGSSIPGPAGPLCWTVAELDPEGDVRIFRYDTKPCAAQPTPDPQGDTREAQP